MAARKKAAAKPATEVVEEVVADDVETVLEEAVEEVEATPSPVVEVAAPAAAPTKVGIPTNTWTLFYGGSVYDFVEGQPTEMPIEVYNYLKKAKNLQATL